MHSNGSRLLVRVWPLLITATEKAAERLRWPAQECEQEAQLAVLARPVTNRARDNLKETRPHDFGHWAALPDRLLTYVKARGNCVVYSTHMSEPNTIDERLRAHARLLLKLASECWNEETAEKLRRLARDCERDTELALLPILNTNRQGNER